MGFHERTQRWACLVAHRRAGKTVAAVNDMIRAAVMYPQHRGLFAYIAPYRSQAKAVAWNYFKEFAQPLATGINEAELTLTLLNGSQIRLYGADNADAMRGLGFAGVYMDEFGDFRPSVWGNVIRPALADKQGWALFISTPDGTASWFYELWQYADSGDSDWSRWQYTTIDGDNVPPEEIEAARGQLDARTFRQEFEASFENLSGLVAVSFGDSNISLESEDIFFLPLLLGVDFNVDPMSGICAVRKDDTLYVFDEIMLTGGATTWDFAEEVTRRFGVDRRVIACPDPTGGARKTSGVGLTDHNLS